MRLTMLGSSEARTDGGLSYLWQPGPWPCAGETYFFAQVKRVLSEQAAVCSFCERVKLSKELTQKYVDETYLTSTV